MGGFKTTLIRAAVIVTAALANAAPVLAQALTPMRQVVVSYEDRFAIQVTPKNPYRHRIKMLVRVYDENFKLIKARVTPRAMMMGAGSSRKVTVEVPFGKNLQKKIRICAESIPYPNQKTKIKAQVCGRFLAKRAR